MRSILVGVVLVGCASGVPYGNLTVRDLVVSACDDEAGAPALSAVAAGPASVDVTHLAHEANCCTDISVRPAQLEWTVTITYAESGEPCDCNCAFDLSYGIDGLSQGAWTVAAGGLTAEVELAGE